MRSVLLLLAAIGLAGCAGIDDPSVIKKNEDSLSGKGTLIGTMRDGREVRRFTIETGDHIPDHYVYVIGDATTVNSGKNVQVIINGRRYSESDEQIPASAIDK